MKLMLTRRQVMFARGLAVVADLLQWVAFPMFMTGVTGVADGVLDVVLCVTLIGVLGWHIAFLPSFISELLPFVDLAPMWTLAVFFATRNWKDPAAVARALPETPPPTPPATL